MASLTKDKKGKWRLRYRRDGREREMTFRANKLNAEKLKLIVEHRLDQMITGDANPQLAKWLKEIPDALREVLERHELCDLAARGITLDDLIQAFVKANPGKKSSTQLTWRNTFNNLRTYFGSTRKLATITALEADKFHVWLRGESRSIGHGTGLKPATYLKRISIIKRIFTLAVRYKWLDENPFEHLKSGNATDGSRMVFVTSADAIKIYDACPNAFWRLVWAFTRWGGLRIRSEFPLLRWDGVDWERSRITVFEPKKTGVGEAFKTRQIPIFPELRGALDEAWDLSDEGDVYLADFYSRIRNGTHVRRDGSWNPTTTLSKIIRRAGLTPWPKLLQNCRSTRETELAEKHPIQAVAAWIGNTPRIAYQHYLQTRDEYFQAASAGESVLSPPADNEKIVALGDTTETPSPDSPRILPRTTP